MAVGIRGLWAKWMESMNESAGVSSEGKHRVLLCGCKGLLTYGEREIRVRLSCGVIRIVGEGMTMRVFHGNRMAIEGKWNAIAWEEEA